MTTFSDQLYHLGGVPVGTLLTAGDVYFLDPTKGSDDNDGKAIDRAKATFAAAYALLTANQNDILYYIGASTLLRMQAALTWAKSYTHFIGICAPTHVAQRARIFQLATLTDASPLLDITASGCIFANFYIYQGVDDTGSLIDVQVTGRRNYFKNVHFAGGGHATQAIDNGASLFVNGGNENLFEDCTIGIDTIEAATGMNALRFDGSASRNMFKNCLINLMISNAGARLVELVDGSAVDRYTRFQDCLFFSNSVNKGTAMASAFEIPAHTTTATIFLERCRGLGFTDWDDDNRGILYLDGGTITGGGNSGFALVSAVT